MLRLVSPGGHKLYLYEWDRSKRIRMPYGVIWLRYINPAFDSLDDASVSYQIGPKSPNDLAAVAEANIMLQSFKLH